LIVVAELHLSQLTPNLVSVKVVYVCFVTVRTLPTAGVPSDDSEMGVAGLLCGVIPTALAGAIESDENIPTLMTPVRTDLKTLFTIFL
jgi:hypothetical protein